MTDGKESFLFSFRLVPGRLAASRLNASWAALVLRKSSGLPNSGRCGKRSLCKKHHLLPRIVSLTDRHSRGLPALSCSSSLALKETTPVFFLSVERRMPVSLIPAYRSPQVVGTESEADAISQQHLEENRVRTEMNSVDIVDPDANV